MQDWTPPAEINQPIPRKVKTRWPYKMLFWLCGAFLSLMSIQFAASLARYSRFEPWASDAVVAYIAGSPRESPRRDLVNQFFTVWGFLSSTIFLYSPYSRERRLIERGTAAAAEIVSETGYPATDGDTTEIAYQFTDQAGQIVRGVRRKFPPKHDERSRSVAMRAKMLDHPTVLYDPADSRKNLLYPGVTVICEQPPDGGKA